MKIINTSSFEKLKIRPVNVKDLKSNTEYSKSTLQTFDIVKLYDKHYITFINEDVVTYNNKKVDIQQLYIKNHQEGVFIRTNEINRDLRYMFIDDYDEKLKRTNGNKYWDVSEIWRCSPERVFQFWNVKSFELNDLTQTKLNEMLVDYDYIMI